MTDRYRDRFADQVPAAPQPPRHADAKEDRAVARGRERTGATTYLRTAEVAGLLHVSPKTVSRWAKEGKLPFLRTLGGHRRYPDNEIRALVDNLYEATD